MPLLVLELPPLLVPVAAAVVHVVSVAVFRACLAVLVMLLFCNLRQLTISRILPAVSAAGWSGGKENSVEASQCWHLVLAHTPFTPEWAVKVGGVTLTVFSHG